MPTKVKTGFITSEFATILAQILFNFALAAGWVDVSQMDDIVQQTAIIISSIVTAIMAIRYISGRIDLKKTSMALQSQEQTKPPALLQ